MNNIALFDFDGTITHTEMYTKFWYYASKNRRSLLRKMILVAPFFILYKVKIISAAKMRCIASFIAFSGRNLDNIAVAGEKFAKEVIPDFIREIALRKLHWHQHNGDQIVIVSASLDVYLKPWCQQNGFALVCSELEVREGKLSGHYVNGDCSSENKPNLIHSRFELNKYDRIYAYGDTKEDFAMLNLADETYLNWQTFTKV